MNTIRSLLVTLLSACTAGVTTNLHAEPVTNWHTFRATTATTLSGQGTSSPTIGSAAAPATSSFVVGYFDGMALTNLGDRITLSFQVSFTDAAGFSTAGDQLRFALFDLNGQARVVAENTATAGVNGQTDDWRGYWFGHRGGGGNGANGSIRERPVALTASDNPFSNTASDPAPSLGAVGGLPVTLVSSTSPGGGAVFTGVMALERSPSGVALAGVLGGNGATNIFSANDNASPFPNVYGAAAYLFGGAMSVDQANLQNVTVTYSSSNALQITSHPTNVTVLPGESAQFTVQWSGSGLLPTFQWRENGTAISGATNSTYAIAFVTPGQHNNTYSVIVSNVFGDSVTSLDATLAVISDTNAPTVLSASSVISNVINVIFSEPVTALTAENTSSYSLSGNSIASITMIGNTNAALTLDDALTGDYVLTVQNVQDAAGNTVATTNVPGIAHGLQDSVRLSSNGVAYAFNDKIFVHADGADIFGTNDQFQYVYRPVSGDFDVAVRVELLVNTDINAKAGLMARVKSGFEPAVIPESRNIMMEATPGRFIFQDRTNAVGAGSVAVASPRPPTAFPNSWVRLARSGAVFTAYSSTNSGAWELIGSYDTSVDAEGAYPAEILLGLAVTSHDIAEITTAVFSEFGPATVSAPTLSIERIGSVVQLSWPASAIGLNLQATPALSDSITWTNVPGSSATNRVQVSPGASALFFRLSN